MTATHIGKRSHSPSRSKDLRHVVVPAIVLGLLATSPLHADSWSRMGAFSNMRFTRDHAYGYSAQLWRHDDTLVGYLLFADGPDVDTPLGVLENVKFDAKTGALSFSAMLCDRFDFAGTLKGNVLSGAVTRRGSATPVKLQLSKEQTGRMPDPPSYQDWQDETDILLRIRGPRC